MEWFLYDEFGEFVNGYASKPEADHANEMHYAGTYEVRPVYSREIWEG